MALTLFRPFRDVVYTGGDGVHPRPVGRDLLRVIEASYDTTSDRDTWLTNVARAVYEHVGERAGMSAFYYRVTDDDRLRVEDAIEIDMPANVGSMMRGVLDGMPPEFVRGSFVRLEAITQSQATDPVAREMGKASMAALSTMFGWQDALMIGGMDPTRHGVYLGAWLRQETKLPPKRRLALTRVAVHVVSAYRLRRRVAELENEVADAILTPGGRLDHAVPEVVAERDVLTTAVKEMERARGRLRRESPEHAVGVWKALVSGRWTLVDQFESDGKRYVLARRNGPSARGPAILSERERDALGFAALGHSNKLIAYEMGIAAATVGVLLHRAARKLGSRSRGELLAAYAKQTDAG